MNPSEDIVYEGQMTIFDFIADPTIKEQESSPMKDEYEEILHDGKTRECVNGNMRIITNEELETKTSRAVPTVTIGCAHDNTGTFAPIKPLSIPKVQVRKRR